jgi:ribosomal protein S12 methylthiotransferase
MAEYKKKLIVTGCLAQRYADELQKDIPEIDHILGSSDFPSIAKVLKPSKKKLPVVQVTETPAYIYDHDAPRVRIGQTHTAYVKIAEGCDRPCSFCIIPKLRGPQRSRRIADIVEEVRQLGAQGVREINLIAQDLTRYGWDAGSDPASRPTLAHLLRALGKVDGVDWIRLHYTFPSAFDDELIDAIASEPKVVKYVDVPLQHISDPMLKRMRRGHSSRVTRELVKKLRERIDDVVLRTTFIVGHPGETDAEFDELCEFVAESKFDRAGAFTYSIEPGTVSAMLPNRVDPAVAEARQQKLMEIQRQISRARHEAMVGKQIDVLVEGVSKESEYLLEGRWYGQAPGIDGVTYLADGKVPPGSLVRARVTQASDYDLAASLEV